LGAIAGALTGLLFVAVSIKSDLLTASPNLSSRAAQSLCLFMTAVLIALLIASPQPRVALGVELLLLAVSSGLLMLILNRRAGHANAKSVIGYWERISPSRACWGGVVTAWLLVVKITAYERKEGGP